jgi:hypothetical protein
MKNFSNLIISSAFLLLCAAGAIAQSVQTDYDHNFNLARFKTFGFYQQERRPGDPLAASPINNRRIHDALAAQLTANGLSASEQPDFMIAYFVSTKQGLDVQDNRFGLLQRRGSLNVSQVTEGTLIVIFADASTRQEVWRGYASGTINPKDLDKDVNKAVTKLVEKFKKNQLGKN